MWLRFCYRELTNQKWFVFAFIANLTIGLLGFSLLDSFKASLSKTLADGSKAILTADIQINARRPLTEMERNTLTSLATSTGVKYTLSHEKTTFSMARVGSQSSLAEVKAFGSNYPLYGFIKLASGDIIQKNSPKPFLDQQQVIVAEDLLIPLKAQLGDSIRLGTRDFKIVGKVIEDSNLSLMATGVAPRIYLSLSQLEATGLIGKKSLVRHYYSLQFHQWIDIESLTDQIQEALTDPQIRTTSHLNAGQDQGRMVSYLTDYLGLVSLVAFFLASMGATWLFQSYLTAKQKDVAILLSLGNSHLATFLVYTFIPTVLGIIAAITALTLTKILLPLFSWLLASLTPVDIEPQVSLTTAITVILLGGLGALLITLPMLTRLRSVHPGQLLHDRITAPSTDWLSRLSVLPPAMAIYFLAVWQANSWVVGSLFTTGMILAGLVIILFGRILLWWTSAWLPRGRPVLVIGLKYLTRFPMETLACFLALSIGTLLVNLIPQIRASIATELKQPEQIPGLFLFDIQDDQLSALKEMLISQNHPLDAHSPMVRSRLMAINGKEFSKNANDSSFSREQQMANRMRNRGVNLSWRSKMSDSETLIKGRFPNTSFRPEDDKIPELTIEARYAQRMGLNLGDTLTFDVQSIPIEGKIVGIRRVRWNSFRPNFFIQFQPGVLEDAPLTWLGTIGQTTEEQRFIIQAAIVDQFPNITVIGVKKIMDKVVAMIDQMTWVMEFMAILSMMAGLVVLFSIANHQSRTRMPDTNLLKILGASFSFLTKASLWEFTLLSACSALTGLMLALGFTWMLTYYLFDGIWGIDWTTSISLWIAITATGSFTTWISVKRTLSKSPALQLQSH